MVNYYGSGCAQRLIGITAEIGGSAELKSVIDVLSAQRLIGITAEIGAPDEHRTSLA